MKRNRYLVLLVFAGFFVMSLVTNILGPLIPDVARSFDLSLTLVAFLPFSFFMAYGFMSIPAGLLMEVAGEKTVMLGAFLISLLGCLMFGLRTTYPMAIASLFVIGIGMATLQVVLNPLLRTAGGEEHFAFNSVLAQFFFGAASFLSPMLYSRLVIDLAAERPARNPVVLLLARVVPEGLAWISLYWVFCGIVGIMVVLVACSRFPKSELPANEKVGGLRSFKQLLRRRIVWLYSIGIFAYVGCEQGTANWISKFLETYHGYDAQTIGARAVSLFWGLMVLGCAAGMVLLKIFDSRRVIVWFTAAAMITLTVALFGAGPAARIAFPAVGFFCSVMWSIVISLALNSVAQHHGSFTGVLCTAIMGGAVVPVIIGAIGDFAGLRAGMMVLYATFGYVLCVGLWAQPLTLNKTIRTHNAAGVAAS
jgi:fucose permease